jgi:hypothetical protein
LSFGFLIALHALVVGLITYGLLRIRRHRLFRLAVAALLCAVTPYLLARWWASPSREGEAIAILAILLLLANLLAAGLTAFAVALLRQRRRT